MIHCTPLSYTVQVLDTNVVLNQMDLLEAPSPALSFIIVLQTVVQVKIGGCTFAKNVVGLSVLPQRLLEGSGSFDAVPDPPAPDFYLSYVVSSCDSDELIRGRLSTGNGDTFSMVVMQVRIIKYHGTYQVRVMTGFQSVSACSCLVCFPAELF